MNKTQIEQLSERMGLSPYQSYILAINGHKYKLDSLVKRGDVLYAPYYCELTRDARDYFGKILYGPRADLIGPDRMLVIGQRGIKLYGTGFYKATDDVGEQYYADSMGRRIARSVFNRFFGIYDR
ncbi:MAG: hypothetical protein FWE17_00245 [Alphaproteobacteria bacterium]|nr:hypothetical protein [Alphaproteobacteria bacterium]MCL2757734.1 hypothetical protein [Alphaproteobacteria bacterium]